MREACARGIEIAAPIDIAFQAMLGQLGPEGQMPLRSVRGSRLCIRPLERGYIQLHHLHHGLNHGLHLRGIPVADELDESPRNLKSWLDIMID